MVEVIRRKSSQPIVKGPKSAYEKKYPSDLLWSNSENIARNQRGHEIRMLCMERPIIPKEYLLQQ